MSSRSQRGVGLTWNAGEKDGGTNELVDPFGGFQIVIGYPIRWKVVGEGVGEGV